MTENVSLYRLVMTYKLCKEEVLFPYQRLHNNELWQLLLSRFQLNEAQLLRIVGDALGLSFSELAQLTCEPDLLTEFDAGCFKEHRFIPLYKQGNILAIAIDNPFNDYVHHLAKMYEVQPTLVTSVDLNSYFGKTEHDDGPALLESWFVQAIDKGASDIHFNQGGDGISVYFRIHGALYEMGVISIHEQSRFKSMIKLHAKMDISCMNRPQDGRLEWHYLDKPYDIRVSSLPTIFGEDFVCRFIQGHSDLATFDSLGFTQQAQSQLLGMLSQPSGLILITGATGSGKSTSLYTCLKALKKNPRLNIVTMEDPVEHVIPGIRQSPICEQANYTFESGLRSVLRQDPDVIMVGEIRDKVSAKTALEAAYTGHLVLSTLHTSDCRSTLMRLQGFDLDPFMVRYSLKGIVSQKLVPRRCVNCMDKADVTGCDVCLYTGVKGRVILSELLSCDDNKKETCNFQNQSLDNKSKQNHISLEDMIKYNTYYSFEDDQKIKRKKNIIN